MGSLLGQLGGCVKLIPVVVHAACLIIRPWGACPPMTGLPDPPLGLDRGSPRLP